ncbi:hypothetical protein HK104_006639 [Borealophlyctis nickersoniae]|nr:hypothetical protein HK104_006639 [Borealophlyctis nickersoniae]
MTAVQLGFVEALEEGTQLTATIDDFPNKVGGMPLWLNPERLLKADDLLCGVCGKVMVLLVQTTPAREE